MAHQPHHIPQPNLGRVAIVFPADVTQGFATDVFQSRFAEVAKSLSGAGLDVVGAPYSDVFVEHVRERLLTCHVVLVWFNPIEGGLDRTILNQLLRDVAGKGVLVSAHPDVIDRMGTKEVLYRTRKMTWGSDVRLYLTSHTLQAGLSESLSSGVARVLKQIRGQSGDGVWKVEPAKSMKASSAQLPPDTSLRVRHAKRGSNEVTISFRDLVALCQPYLASGGVIDQPYQNRLTEGMIRCYVVGDRVAGFGEQLINALYPALQGASSGTAPQPGPRQYFPPTRPDFQRLKQQLESVWIPELCDLVGIEKSGLPVLWDADFLFGAKSVDGTDTFVLCEINVSSVYPFPPTAMAPLVERVVTWIKAGSKN